MRLSHLMRPHAIQKLLIFSRIYFSCLAISARNSASTFAASFKPLASASFTHLLSNAAFQVCRHHRMDRSSLVRLEKYMFVLLSFLFFVTIFSITWHRLLCHSLVRSVFIASKHTPSFLKVKHLLKPPLQGGGCLLKQCFCFFLFLLLH